MPDSSGPDSSGPDSRGPDSSGHPAARPRHVQPVAWQRLVDALRPVLVSGEGSPSVTGISLASDRVQPGDLYAALPGARVHGAEFARAALDAGAVGVLTDEAGAALLPAGVPTLVVPDPRASLGELAALVNGEPARRLTLIGVTGTQGKTTTTRLLETALSGAGITAAVVGTIGTRVAGVDLKTSLTTPEAPDLHALFAAMVEQHVAVCAMEVSSHALVKGRVDGVVFDVAVFTNLGRDHLDFHADEEDYFQAKASLFTPARSRTGLVNVDDPHGRRLVTEASVPIRTFSPSGASADWRVTEAEPGPSGSRFALVGPDGVRLESHVGIPGVFHVANAAIALAAAAEAGLDPAPLAEALARGAGVPGRLEPVEEGQDFVVLVDYAHKPDAIAAALTTLRPLTDGTLTVVLGAGGDRDRGKRPLMGEIAARLADVVIVTDDNPRTEDPAAIRAEVLAGAAGPARVQEVGDRAEAIRTALRAARPGDIVLLAGKGHETGQEVHGVVHPFDDGQVAREELHRMRHNDARPAEGNHEGKAE